MEKVAELKYVLVALLTILLGSSQASAATITYTTAGIFSGHVNGSEFVARRYVFTGVGDTDDNFEILGNTYYNLTSFTATDGTNTLIYNPGVVFAFGNDRGAAGSFPDGAIFDFSGVGNYLGAASLPETPVNFIYDANANSDGIDGSNFTAARFTSASDLTFLAVAAVPEPTTWALLVCGFGLLGASLRQRKALSKSAIFRYS